MDGLLLLVAYNALPTMLWFVIAYYLLKLVTKRELSNLSTLFSYLLAAGFSALAVTAGAQPTIAQIIMAIASVALFFFFAGVPVRKKERTPEG